MFVFKHHCCPFRIVSVSCPKRRFGWAFTLSNIFVTGSHIAHLERPNKGSCQVTHFDDVPGTTFESNLIIKMTAVVLVGCGCGWHMALNRTA